jgi:hypothetical protein
MTARIPVLTHRVLAGLNGHERTIGALAVLLVMGFTVFGPAIWLLPANEDDLIMLSVAARARTPAAFFVGDWGMGNHAYRPLHVLAIWVGYRLFGVSAGYNQLLNLLLHLLCTGLLCLIIRSVQKDTTLAMLLTALSLVSLYTVSPAIWVSDRSTLLVAVCLLLWLREVLPEQSADRSVPLGRLMPTLAVLSVAALLSKESGVIVPLFGACGAIVARKPIRSRLGLVILAAAILVGYGLFRVAIFGDEAFVFTKSGFLFGIEPYDSWADLSPGVRALALLDNVAKNIVATFLPILGGFGALASGSTLLKTAVIWLPVAVLTVGAARRPLSSVQKAGLLIVLLNGVIHYPLFRSRTMYLAQIGFVLFVAGARRWDGDTGRRFARVLATVCLVGNLVWVSQNINAEVVARTRMLTPASLESMAVHAQGRIDPGLIERVLRRYGAEQ